MDTIAWIDTETTGLNPVKQDVIQIALLMEQGGEIVERAEFKCQPYSWENIKQQALDVHGYSVEQLREFPEPFSVCTDVVGLLTQYREDAEFNRLTFAGYNCPFDMGFVRQWFIKSGIDMGVFDILFDYHTYDAMSLFKGYTKANNIKVPNHKLITAAAHFGLTHNAHDAMSDIEVTYQVAKKIEEIMRGGGTPCVPTTP